MAITAAKEVIERLRVRAGEIPLSMRSHIGTDLLMEHLIRAEGEEVDIDALYREVLNERYAPVVFGEIEYSPAEILEAVDLQRFRDGVQLNAESEIRDSWLIALDGKCYRLEGITD